MKRIWDCVSFISFKRGKCLSFQSTSFISCAQSGFVLSRIIKLLTFCRGQMVLPLGER